MASNPSTLLLKYAKTDDLIAEWLSLNNRAKYMGLCLKARFGGGGGNPSLMDWQQGRIDKSDYLIIMSLVEIYDSMFSLFQSGWAYIYEEIKNFDQYPNNEVCFFLNVVKQEFDYEFIRAVKGYKQNFREVEEKSKTLRDIIYKGNWWTEEPSSERYIDYETWVSIAMNACAKHAKKDEAIKNLLDNFLHQCAKAHDLIAREAARERRSNPPRRIQSVKWENGRRYVGARGTWKLAVTEVHKPNPNF